MGPDADPNDPTPGMHIWGWMAPVELRWLADTARTMRSIVEVGCLRGRSAFALATACPGVVHCVDPWSDDGWAAFNESCGHFDNVRMHRTTSPEVASAIGTVDMVFLDGDHDYRAMLADLAVWTPRARVLLCGHDYTVGADGGPGGFPGVKRAVDDVFGDQVTIAPDTSIWCYRP